MRGVQLSTVVMLAAASATAAAQSPAPGSPVGANQSITVGGSQSPGLQGRSAPGGGGRNEIAVQDTPGGAEEQTRRPAGVNATPSDVQQQQDQSNDTRFNGRYAVPGARHRYTPSGR